MRVPLLIPAVLLILIGGVFALQGAGFLPSAVMHGKPEWLVIGLVMVIAGLFLGFRARPRPPIQP
ncbi:MAG TPA: hypothetical protein VGR61_05845 [Candidatus Dormibacteraeota bacterium]|nr:hypothetical protein [Candidatus Dormibacteraeota bacterium]